MDELDVRPLNAHMQTIIAIILLATSGIIFAAEQPLKDCCTRLGISGRIVDAVTGKPVFGAKVWFQYQFMTSGLAMRFPGEAITGSDGRFAIPSQFVKRKFLYGITDDPTDPKAWKPDVPVKIQVEHPDYEVLRYDFPTKRQNRKVPYLRQTYPIFKDGTDYHLKPNR